MTEGQPIESGPIDISKSPSPAKPDKKLVIRTMRDDLAQARQSSSLPKASSPEPVVQAREGKGQVDDASKVVPATGRPASLQPNLPMATPEPEEFEPIVPKKQTNKVLVTLLVIFLLLAIGAGGLWGWIYINDSSNDVEVPDANVVLTMTEVIPANALLIAHYTVNDPAQSARIQRVWSNSSNQESATMLATMTGDPRLMLSKGITEFMYVLLPGDPRYYLVLEGSTLVDQFLAEYRNIQVSTIGQWRVVHSFSTDLYEQALALDSMAENIPRLAAGSDPLVITLERQLLEQSHKYADRIVPESGYIDLGVSFTETEAGAVASLNSPVGTLVPPGVLSDVTDILLRVPADAGFVRIGNSFADQAYRVTTPTTAQLFSTLTAPYAYFERVGNDGVNDAGIIIRIPEEQRASFTIPDARVEEALPEFISAASLGEKPAVGLTFADVVYNEVPLRYVNLSTHQLALDYTIGGGFLMVSTSREGMEMIVDVALEELPNALDAPSWAIIEQLTAIHSNDRIYGAVIQPAIKRLFPGGEQVSELPFGIAFNPSAITQAVAGTILLP